MRRAFTLVEVLATLLIIGTGMLAVVALAAYAVAQAGRAQAGHTAMATALSVAADPQPLRALDWRRTPAPAGGGAALAEGMVNGYFVRRSETVDAPAAAGLAGAAIRVEVYDGAGGSLVAAYATRRMRRD